jgi:tetratricopeptide (TPR) repeat protein
MMRVSIRIALASIAAPAMLLAQRGPSTPQADSLRQASQFDLDGEYPKARAIFQKLIDGAPDALAKAQAQRAFAISYAFTSECTSAAILEMKVIGYWVTREKAEPQNAFYQEGEVSNEAARICFDAGDYDAAETYYRRGSELGLKEPEPKTHPASLWDFRLTHALARISTRRRNYDEAAKLVDRARAILDGDKVMAAQQERFYPYLLGYVGLYARTQDPFPAPGNWGDIQHNLVTATEMQGNEGDPYFHWLLADYLTSENQVIAECHRALDRATAHNPPSAYVHAHAKECLDPALIDRRKFTRRP